jgi:hypothetical protein
LPVVGSRDYRLELEPLPIIGLKLAGSAWQRLHDVPPVSLLSAPGIATMDPASWDRNLSRPPMSLESLRALPPECLPAVGLCLWRVIAAERPGASCGLKRKEPQGFTLGAHWKTGILTGSQFEQNEADQLPGNIRPS